MDTLRVCLHGLKLPSEYYLCRILVRCTHSCSSSILTNSTFPSCLLVPLVVVLFFHAPFTFIIFLLSYINYDPSTYFSITALQNEPRWIKTEFTEKLDFCKEFSTEILPDTTTLESKEFRGLLFSIY